MVGQKRAAATTPAEQPPKIPRATTAAGKALHTGTASAIQEAMKVRDVTVCTQGAHMLKHQGFPQRDCYLFICKLLNYT